MNAAPHPAHRTQSVNFTVLVKNNIIFPQFDVRFSNYINGNVSNCNWSPDSQSCAIFKLSDMAKQAGISDFSTVIGLTHNVHH